MKHIRKLSYPAKIVLVAVLSVSMPFLAFPASVDAACSDPGVTHMYLFWDPTSSYTFPSSQGWVLTTAYNGRFVRGDTPANALTTGGDGSRPFTPTVTAAVQAPNQTQTGGGGGQFASSTHTHDPPTFTTGADSNGDASNPDVPAFRSLQLMEYLPSSGSCLPTTIPAGAIALFSSTTLPTGFTSYTADNSKTLRIDSSVTTGGGDTVTNTISNISGLGIDPNGASDGSARISLFANSATTSATTHTHGPPSPNYVTTTPTSALPPYVQPVLGQSTIDIPTLSINITALFDGDPGSSWNILSGSGGAYNQQFVRPGSTVNLVSQGSLTHSDPTATVVSGPATPLDNTNKTWNLGGGSLATGDHTHNINFTFGAVSNVPPYVNFVIAQKVSFVLNHYQWYVDPPGASGTQTDVTDAWPSGSLNIAPDAQLPAIPAPYMPPDSQASTQLRLRVQILVAGNALPANGTAFKLQYQATANSDCLSGTWTDVGASGAVWNYGTNNVTDGSPIITTVLAGSNVKQVFSKSASAGTPNTGATGSMMEYDWLLQDTSAASGMEYHIRVIETDGTPLGSYRNTSTFNPECPDVITKPGINQELRHGEFFLANPNTGQDPDQGFEWAD